LRASLKKRGHALLQFLKIEFQRRGARDPDEIDFRRSVREMAAINFAHPAAELVALHRAAESFGRQESDRSGLAGLDRVARKKIEREKSVADTPALVAGGVKDTAAADDPGAGKRFGLG